jgi:hypothetical protein
MVIWKGLGILVILAGIAGMIVGGFLGAAVGLGAFTGAFGAVVAALVNFGLCKLLYRRPARVLVDPATGQQLLHRPSHSLFFIPAYAWTWIFLVLAVPLAVGGMGVASLEKKNAATPGYTGFNAANDLIGSKSKGTTHGNSPEAKAAADTFSESFKRLQQLAFTGGSKRNLLTGGEFLTYCQNGKDSIAFLCHVPELRNYKDDDTKNSLAEIAWMTAKMAAQKLDPEGKKNLVVGLRGISSYGFLLSGKPSDEKPQRAEESKKAEILYPPFIDSQDSPAPTPKP